MFAFGGNIREEIRGAVSKLSAPALFMGEVYGRSGRWDGTGARDDGRAIGVGLRVGAGAGCGGGAGIFASISISAVSSLVIWRAIWS
jgi:hypothetical protein